MENNIEIFVPGRLCILGEHSDWAAGYRKVDNSIKKGYAIVAGLNLGIYLRGCKSQGFYYEYKDNIISLSCEELMNYDKKDFFEYVIASAKMMHSKYKVSGAKIVCDKMSLPIKKGLASSAAICVAVIRIYNILFELNLSIEKEMELAYEAELSIGSLCGKMDQVCAYGQGIRKIIFDADNIEIVSLPIDKELRFILVDLKGEKNTKKILSDLNNEFNSEVHSGNQILINALGKFNEMCIEKAIKNLIDGDSLKFARALEKFQENFDKNIACFSEELQSPRLHNVMKYCKGNDCILACKGTGSQGDGMAQILIDSYANVDNIMADIRNTLGFESYLFSVGQEELNAIVPIAGKGTRMYPYTYIVDKAFLPIVHSEKVYPAICLILKELFFSECVGKVNLIVNEKQHGFIEGIEKVLECDNIEFPISYTFQKGYGFGSAIVSSEFIYEPGFSLICLGDYIYRGKKYGCCTNQLIEFWKKHRKSVVGIKAVSIDETEKFGIVYGHWVDHNIMKIERIVEKPNIEYVKDNLLIEYSSELKVFAFFGEYIIDNDILRRMSLSDREKEVGFSEYLNEYVQRQSMYAIVIDGDSFDLGNPNDYYESFVEYGKDNV